MHINRLSFLRIADAIVDDEQWYSVIVSGPVAAWLREQDKTLVSEVVGITLATTFDVHETIYSTLVLKWT